MTFLKKIGEYILSKSNSYNYYKNNYNDIKKQYDLLNEEKTRSIADYNKLDSFNKKNLEEIDYLRTLNKTNNEEIKRLTQVNQENIKEINKLLSLIENFNISFNQLRMLYVEQNDFLKNQIGFNVQKLENFLFEFSGSIEDFDEKFDDLNKVLFEKLEKEDDNYMSIKHALDGTSREFREANDKNNTELVQLRNNFVDKYDELKYDFNNIKNMLSDNNEYLLEYLENNLDLNKLDILNKISDELSREDYTNIDSFKKIKEMNLFDETYYKEKYNYDEDINPLLHYIYKGYAENKNPSKDFDNLYYKQSATNVKESSLNPLVYFVSRGINEGNIKFKDKMVLVHHINKYELDYKIKKFYKMGITRRSRTPQVIVSLTSFPERMYDIHYCLYSILNQSFKPNKVILWLSKEEFPDGELDVPKEVLKLKENGLTIEFCKNIKSYKKIIPTLKKYPDDIIVTADDDVFYPKNWLKLLYDDYLQNKETIIAHRCRRIFIEKNNIADYDKWDLIKDDYTPYYRNMATGAGGVLYPPNSLNKDVTDESKFMKLCANGDDIWFWAMAVLNKTKIKVANHHLNNSLTYVNPARERNLINEEPLWYRNVTEQKNTKNFANVLKEYPQLRKIILDEKETSN